jgi:Tfp pilus assembly protein PilE
MILGILGLLLSVFGVGLLFALIGVILGIVALRTIGKTQTSSTPQTGKGMAITGIVTGALGLIVGSILVIAISIPVYLNQRENASSALVQSELRNAAVAQETYWVEYGTYASDVTSLQSAGYTPSSSVSITTASMGPSSYCLQGSAANSATYHYDSTTSSLSEGPC